MNPETKELLTLAAKAMGFEVRGFSSVGNAIIKTPGGGPESCLANEWNPLTTADDLVEMECQMSVETVWTEDRCIATAWSTFARECFGAHELYSKHPSRRAAKAMASLRVVAEIGKMMEGE